MGSEAQDKPSYEELALRLSKMEEVFHNCQRLSVANQFAASVMHEVNNPLEAITNLVYLTKHEHNPEQARSYLDTVEEQLMVLADITRASLSFYRDQATMKEVDLVKVAESALKVHFARLSRMGLEVCERHSDNAVCKGVASEILQVISNLILNSIESISDDQQGRLHVRVRRCSEAVHITVADNGSGIPAEIEAQLFEAHVTGKQTGTGLGLWGSKRILLKHGAMIKYRTSRTLGKSGTVFRIQLPLIEAA